jgi:hypothetical protein
VLFNWAPRHEGVLREWMYSSTHLDIGSRWRWMVSFTSRPLYPQGKTPWYLLNRRLGGSQSRSGRGGKEKNSQTLPGVEPPIIQPVAHRYTTELSRLVHLDNCILETKFIVLGDCSIICKRVYINPLFYCILFYLGLVRYVSLYFKFWENYILCIFYVLRIWTCRQTRRLSEW